MKLLQKGRVDFRKVFSTIHLQATWTCYIVTAERIQKHSLECSYV